MNESFQLPVQVPHKRICTGSLKHSRPPNAGFGFVQLRCRSIIPQLSEQDDHFDQSDRPPSTITHIITLGAL